MGNNSTKAVSTINDWEKIDTDNGIQIYRNNLNNQLAEKRIISVDSHYDINDQLKIYQMRQHNQDALVQVFATQNMDKKKSVEGFCSAGKKMIVYTQKIPYRLSELPQLTFPETLLFLRQSLKAYQRVFKNYGPIHVTSNLIGINDSGEVKSWVNENWALNHPTHELATLQTTKLEDLSKEQYLSYGAKYRDQTEMVHNIVAVVEQKCEEGKFPKVFAEQLALHSSSFKKLQIYLQDFIKFNQIFINPKINYETVFISKYQTRLSQQHKMPGNLNVQPQVNKNYQNNVYDPSTINTQKQAVNVQPATFGVSTGPYNISGPANYNSGLSTSILKNSQNNNRQQIQGKYGYGNYSLDSQKSKEPVFRIEPRSSNITVNNPTSNTNYNPSPITPSYQSQYGNVSPNYSSSLPYNSGIGYSNTNTIPSYVNNTNKYQDFRRTNDNGGTSYRTTTTISGFTSRIPNQTGYKPSFQPAKTYETMNTSHYQPAYSTQTVNGYPGPVLTGTAPQNSFSAYSFDGNTNFASNMNGIGAERFGTSNLVNQNIADKYTGTGYSNVLTRYETSGNRDIQEMQSYPINTQNKFVTNVTSTQVGRGSRVDSKVGANSGLSAKNSHNVNLQNQSLQVLAKLVERASNQV